MTIGAGAAVAATLLGQSVAPAFAANNFDDVIKKFTGGKTPAAGPRQARPAGDRRERQHRADDRHGRKPDDRAVHVTDVLIVADGNPHAGVATFHFSPASGVAEANTRIRLADTQNIIAVAKMNDGSFFTASKQVKVTIGGCGG